MKTSRCLRCGFTICAMCSGSGVIPGPRLGITIPCPKCFPTPIDDNKGLTEVLDFLRCLKGNHTIDFNKVPRMCDLLFNYICGDRSEYGDSLDDKTLDEYKDYFQ